MIFKESHLKGLFLIEMEILADDRGYFSRSFCKREFAKHGLDNNIVQCNLSFNKKKGTIRGMHFQTPPFEECKIVSCIKGRIYDVVIDLRESSETYCQWQSYELTAENKLQLFIPKGFAHGFQTLEDDTEVYYQMTEYYNPDYQDGVRWNDKRFVIEWPYSSSHVISQKDQQWRDYNK